MEDLLRAAVLEHHDTNTVYAQLVVVVTTRAVGPFPSYDALVAWSGGLAVLHEELQLRLPARCCDRHPCATGRYSPLSVC